MNYRIVHTSDIHVWDFPVNPVLWVGKRTLGLGNLILRRARKFRKEQLLNLAATIEEDQPDHLVLSGDVSTTSLSSEFEKIHLAFQEWLGDPRSATVVPGNHDRYTQWAQRRRLFDRYFGNTTHNEPYPMIKNLTRGLDLIGFDPCRPQPISARGLAKLSHIKSLRRIVSQIHPDETKCVIFACHYPGEVPREFLRFEKGHEMVNARLVVKSLAALHCPVYWLHGHIHYPWRYPSPTASNVVYLNPGAPLLKRKTGISFGRWILDWDGVDVTAEWKSAPNSARELVDFA
ncbi:MAG: metallophosphoesterase [Candidatus Omnitrophica bacterium]|nr:metallophosphoesterase [Candidatus Omnitrophota bacterium]MCA9445938.1 metallophosphoesterase [Candidatus Omnitrophota bacterium]MCB9767227.1 metallophosphoesterase [Candidatus Omnitrophota bacterium]MCB9781403.1 metallophosphoesterase [Candidatus Omnitrophota bacterium]